MVIANTLTSDNVADQSRRLAGTLLGLSVGLAYGIVSSSINPIVLWGIPLRGVSVESIAISALASGLGGMAAGCITAWPRSSVRGIFVGALVITLFGVLKTFLSQSQEALAMIATGVILIYFFLPSVALSLPISGVLRLATNWYQAVLQHSGRAQQLHVGIVWVGLIALGLYIGTFAQMTPSEQAALREVDALIQTGLAPRTDAYVPTPLTTIDHFRARASWDYTLDRHVNVSLDPTVSLPIGVETVAVDALFSSGLHIQCLVAANFAQPLCTELSKTEP